ncbi:MAG: hypothetical protein JWM74_5797 [Myxococcaceae bacterium]|nr:hypothetical protein [Myxococcaceae bacterium]
MGNDEYRKLVERASVEAARYPRLHQLRIVGLVVLGYAYLLAVLAFILTVVGFALLRFVHEGGKGPVAGYPLGLLIITGGALVRAFATKVRAPRPEGTTLREHEAPALFAELRALRRRLRAPAIHEVIINTRFNAGVVHVPRRILGWFGVSRRCLVLGLPFLDAMDVVRFRAVLAHELGHVAGGHGRFSVWTYGVRATWIAFLSSRDIRHSPQRIFTAFFDWFAPRFLANTFVLARANEYAADQTSAREVGPSTVASMLVRTEIMGRFHEHFLTNALEAARFQIEPPVSVFDELAEAALAGPDDELAQRFHADAFSRSTDLDDVHPCLVDRLRALGVEDHGAIAWKVEGSASAAQELLGSAAMAHVRYDLATRWAASVGGLWRSKRQRLIDARATQQAFAARLANGEVLTFDQRVALLSSTLAVDGLATGKPAAERFVADFPASALGRMVLAEILLVTENDDGLAQLHAAMAIDRGTIREGCALAHAYLEASGRREQAETYRVYAATEAYAVAYYYAERQYVRTGDKLEPHGLGADWVQWLARELGRIPDLRGAFLVRKAVQCAPEQPCLVLALDLVPRLVNDSRRRERGFLEAVSAMPLPPGTMVFILRRVPSAPRAEIMRIQGARVL